MTPNFPIILLLFFFSGVTSLIYEVLWLKELGLLFGNASYAMATTLTAFFAGLGVGSLHWGRWVSTSRNALRLYGLLELGVAGCAAGYFLILQAYAFIYPQLFSWLGDNRSAFTLVKFALSLLILFPPAWFMGGTLPVISHFVVSEAEQLGSRVSLLYAVNTFGAVGGVFLAGFLLPGILGFANSYLLAMSMTVLVSLTAIVLSGTHRCRPMRQKATGQHRNTIPFPLSMLAFLSGLLMLSLQVLWGRMFAQVLQNSVYTFAVILMVFLCSLALAGVLANRLMCLRLNKELMMFALLMGGALWVAVTPFEFIYFTDNLRYIGSDTGWSNYLLSVLSAAFLIMGPPLLLLGCVFPLLIKLHEQKEGITGAIVGHLAAINTAGAIAGSLLAGFVILDTLGLWAGIRLMAVVYMLTAWLWLGDWAVRKSIALVPAAAILLVVSVLDTSKLPVVSVDPVVEGESLLQVWEGSSGTVAVIRRGEYLKLKVNNYYTLGGTGSFEFEQLQGYLPVLLHTDPESVYVLGMGTGITAGAVLSYPVDKLVVTELIPEVVTAAEKYFGRYNNHLFFDPRVSVVVEDGRNYLRGTQQKFDVIISDLFVPWKAGAGNLYSLEHYQTVKSHLNGQGVFMQWLPAYQLSAGEFNVIARTMLKVFPQVTVWRGDFSALKPIIGLLGHRSAQPLTKNALLFRNQNAAARQIPLLAYFVGNLEPLRGQFEAVPLNTDDHPVIEFQAPITQRRIKSGTLRWIAGDELIAFMQRLMRANQFNYFSGLNERQQRLPEAGFHLHRAQVRRYQGKLTQAEKDMQLAERLLAAPVKR